MNVVANGPSDGRCCCTPIAIALPRCNKDTEKWTTAIKWWSANPGPQGIEGWKAWRWRSPAGVDGVGLSRLNWTAQRLQSSGVPEDCVSRHRELLQSAPAGPFERQDLRYWGCTVRALSSTSIRVPSQRLPALSRRACLPQFCTLVFQAKGRLWQLLEALTKSIDKNYRKILVIACFYYCCCCVTSTYALWPRKSACAMIPPIQTFAKSNCSLSH